MIFFCFFVYWRTLAFIFVKKASFVSLYFSIKHLKVLKRHFRGIGAVQRARVEEASLELASSIFMLGTASAKGKKKLHFKISSNGLLEFSPYVCSFEKFHFQSRTYRPTLKNISLYT